MVRPQYGTQIISQPQVSDIEQLSINDQTKYQIVPVVDGTEKATDKCSNSESLKMNRQNTKFYQWWMELKKSPTNVQMVNY